MQSHSQDGTKSFTDMSEIAFLLYNGSVGRAQLHGNYSVTTRVWKH